MTLDFQLKLEMWLYYTDRAGYILRYKMLRTDPSYHTFQIWPAISNRYRPYRNILQPAGRSGSTWARSDQWENKTKIFHLSDKNVEDAAMQSRNYQIIYQFSSEKLQGNSQNKTSDISIIISKIKRLILFLCFILDLIAKIVDNFRWKICWVLAWWSASVLAGPWRTSTEEASWHQSTLTSPDQVRSSPLSLCRVTFYLHRWRHT